MASCLAIVPIRRCVCIDEAQQEGNAIWDGLEVARAAMSAKNRLTPLPQKFITFIIFINFFTFDTFDALAIEAGCTERRRLPRWSGC